jgi:hypothetical protein
MAESQKFYIVKRPTGNCEIIAGDSVPDNEESHRLLRRTTTEPAVTVGQIVEQWGPFESADEAIARRVGLIRSGKCQPK